MKIKGIIRTLIESGEDFSDHATPAQMPMHVDGRFPAQEPCAFCDAWRAAQALVRLPLPLADLYDAGTSVWLPGQVRGRVVGTDIRVCVEVQNGEHGPWAVGSFLPVDLTPRDAVEFTYWFDKDGDIWERRESDSLMRLYAWGPGSASGKLETPCDWSQVKTRFTQIEAHHGGSAGLVQVEKP